MKDFRSSLEDTLETVQKNAKTYIPMAIIFIILMGTVCAVAFFSTVKGSEEVLVPDVVGKELSEALLDMQIKELYPKIQLRYSGSPDEKGHILSQEPEAGAIVKAGRRIQLTVSRGVIIDHVENFIGQKFEDVKIHLQTLFPSSRPLISLKEPPLYVFNEAEPGTVLEQNPPPETNISDPLQIELVVSKGRRAEQIQIPAMRGLSVNDLLIQMSRSKIIFDITEQPAQADETPGTVISQNPPAGTVREIYTRAELVLAVPEQQTGTIAYGVFSANLPEYPYPVQIQLDALGKNGNLQPVITMNHPGKLCTIPYAVPRNTVLILSVLGKEITRITVR
ncbi:MAG: PASTA domain-containing protein [Bacteroides sp.]|nr:PASTA domain-containing protein [Prevotella sp.]MCM1407132.1 PASTA domain-containing protein [Treponema brennaborense]MCM1470284.1 PASTA domain-containing protein [Bacteroides sp.]